MRIILLTFTLSFLTLLSFGQVEIKLEAPCINIPDTIQGQEVALAPDIYAEYPGGRAEMYNFIIKNLNHSLQPEFAGTIWATFVIDTNGVVTNSCIFNRDNNFLYTAIENETIRVIGLFPKWKPAEKSQRKVPSRFQFPLMLMPNKDNGAE